MTSEELESRTITFLRFPLIVGVVLIHSRMEDIVMGGVTVFNCADFPLYTVVSNLLSNVFARIAVPLFFFISGFLFFYRTSFGLHAYFQKLRKRVQSILFPYLFWNLLVIGLFFLAQMVTPSLMSGTNKPITDYSFLDWLKAFWAKDSSDPDKVGMPADYPLWFMRDLMVVMVASPLVFGLVRYLRQYAVIALGLFWMISWWIEIPGFSLTALFFFSAGAFFSVHGRNIVTDLRPLLFPAVVLYVVLVVCDLCFMGDTWHRYLHSVGIIVGCILAITLSAACLEKGWWRAINFLASSSFFIYAYHGMPLSLIIKLTVRYFPPESEAAMIGLYLGSSLLVILIGIGLFALMKRYLPAFLAVITGGR